MLNTITIKPYFQGAWDCEGFIINEICKEDYEEYIADEELEESILFENSNKQFNLVGSDEFKDKYSEYKIVYDSADISFYSTPKGKYYYILIPLNAHLESNLSTVDLDIVDDFDETFTKAIKEINKCS